MAEHKCVCLGFFHPTYRSYFTTVITGSGGHLAIQFRIRFGKSRILRTNFWDGFAKQATKEEAFSSGNHLFKHHFWRRLKDQESSGSSGSHFVWKKVYQIPHKTHLLINKHQPPKQHYTMLKSQILKMMDWKMALGNSLTVVPN